MKKLGICILLLTSSLYSKIGACGFYPHGEEIRFCFTHSKELGLLEFSNFDYSVHSFYYEGIIERQENIDLWFQFCHKKVSKEAIETAVYTTPFYEFNETSNNKMIQYLYEVKDIETIEYLKFAKSCEPFNRQYEDPWEKSESREIKKREEVIQIANKRINEVKDPSLKKRYAFLAIRLQYYNKNRKEIIRLFNTYIAKESKKDIIYYWSLYFRTKAENNDALQSYYAAQVFTNSAEKRSTIFNNFNFKIPEKEILKYAKNNKEKANIYVVKGINKYAKALNYLQKIAKIDVENKFLPFLMLREINKLEDWILTPYFSLYNPALSETKADERYNDSFSYKAIQDRIQKDRLYAEKVLTFLETLPSTIKNEKVWRVLKIQLQYLTANYKEALKEINSLETSVNKDSKIYSQIERTKALCTIAVQVNGEKRITNEIEQVILKNKENKKFVFALGRLLEYGGNKVDAALIYAGLTTKREGYYPSTEVSWKSKKNKTYSYRDYFSNYFEYINVMYSLEEVKEIIAKIQKNSTKTDSFSLWKYSYIKNDIPKLYDLVGTMHIRRNQLNKALTYFNKLEDTYWDKTAYLWGKVDDKGKRDFQNPFYKLNYTHRFIKEKENFKLNKKTVTAKLIEYLEKVKTVKNKDYYYFLVANCYYNMTYYGNAWMMRRFGMSGYDTEPYPEDEPEYMRAILAKKYYNLALKNATNDDFKILCLKMIYKCEYLEKRDTDKQKFNYSVFKKQSRTSEKLKEMNEYAEIGACAFHDYFKPSSED